MSDSPFFSIIIPTYDRPEQLEACLRSIASLVYPRVRFEVIVVDDGGEASLKEVFSEFREKINLIFLRQDHAGPAAARNAGVENAKGKFLIFTDDDCQVPPSYLSTLESNIMKHEDAAIAGRAVNAVADNIFSETSQKLLDYLYDYYNADRENPKFVVSNCVTFPIAQFKSLGGFAVYFSWAGGEDREILDRWIEAGYKIIYVKEFLVYHFHCLDLTHFWKQHFTYGRGAFHYHRLRTQRNGGQIRIEPISFYLNLLAFPFSREDVFKALRISILLIISQVANAAGFFMEKLKCKRK